MVMQDVLFLQFQQCFVTKISLHNLQVRRMLFTFVSCSFFILQKRVLREIFPLFRSRNCNLNSSKFCVTRNFVQLTNASRILTTFLQPDFWFVFILPDLWLIQPHIFVFCALYKNFTQDKSTSIHAINNSANEKTYIYVPGAERRDHPEWFLP